MEIRILSVGKIKERYLNDAISEYAKRLSRYCKLTFIQVADEKTPDKASEALNRQIKETEGQRPHSTQYFAAVFAGRLCAVSGGRQGT